MWLFLIQRMHWSISIDKSNFYSTVHGILQTAADSPLEMHIVSIIKVPLFNSWNRRWLHTRNWSEIKINLVAWYWMIALCHFAMNEEPFMFYVCQSYKYNSSFKSHGWCKIILQWQCTVRLYLYGYTSQFILKVDSVECSTSSYYQSCFSCSASICVNYLHNLELIKTKVKNL